MNDQYDVFLWYRRPGAQTAKLLKRFLEQERVKASVWYSDKEPVGNFKYDIPHLIGGASCAVMFIDPRFTDGFLKNRDSCISGMEVCFIARKALEQSDFHLILVYLDREKKLSAREKKILRQRFEGELEDPDRAVEVFSLANSLHFMTASDQEEELFSTIRDSMLPSGFYSRRKADGNFYFSGLRTSADVVLWDLSRGIRSSDVSFSPDGEIPALYGRIEGIRAPAEQISQNDRMLSLTGLRCGLSDNEERKQLEIRYRQIEYRLFRKTLKLWDHPRLNIPQRLSRYEGTERISAYEIPNAMGMAFFVVSSDHQLLFSTRSEERGLRPGETDCSVVEGLKPEAEDSAGPYSVDSPDYLEREMRRAFREEICSDDAGLCCQIVGLVLDRQYGQWNLVGILRPAADAARLLRRTCVRDDTYEKTRLEAVPLRDAEGKPSLEAVREKLRIARRRPMWGMAYTALYAALRSEGFSDGEIDTLLPEEAGET